MTCYLLILPWGTVCSVKHCGRGGTYFYIADGER